MCQTAMKILERRSSPISKVQKKLKDDILVVSITSDYGFLLPVENAFTVDTDKYYPRH